MVRKLSAILPLPLCASVIVSLGLLASAQTYDRDPSTTGPDQRSAADWWEPGDERPFPAAINYLNRHGLTRTLLEDGPVETTGHPFFEPMGDTGRACITCHQPADAMSLSLASIEARWRDTNGEDPLFNPLDGANCPNLPQGERASHSLLLDHGLIRIEREWPPRDHAGKTIRPDFELETIRDPNGCNSDERGPAKGAVSVYRRPRPVSNLKYLEAMGFAYDPKVGMPLPLDPETNQPASGNLLADSRALSLNAQARDAMRTHLGLTNDLDEDVVDEIVAFERRLFSAQAYADKAGLLDQFGAAGGPETLQKSEPGQLGSQGRAVWSEYAPWETIPEDANIAPEARAFMESVARGARIFRERMFLITDSAGINSPIGFGNPVLNSCVFCHNMSQMGNDVAPGQVDLGTTNHPFADPAPHLPLFKITCTGEPHPHLGEVIYTQDPGFALTTGRCADVGKITLQSMRGLAARAPYFSNGSAKTLMEVIDFYDRRYNIGYTDQEKQDLVNLMSVL